MDEDHSYCDEDFITELQTSVGNHDEERKILFEDYGYCSDDFLVPICPNTLCCNLDSFMKLSKSLNITDAPSLMECENCKQSWFLCRKSTQCAICLDDIIWSDPNYYCTVCLKGSHSTCYLNKPPNNCAHCRSSF